MSATGTSEPVEAVHRARAGNAEAWGELYQKFAPAIFRFCRRALPAREDAEDATSEIFMKVREKIGLYDPSRSFTAWLYKVAANHCWDTLRRRKGRQDKETEDATELPLESATPDQLERLIEKSTNEQVRGALARLPARARMALVMRYYSELSYEEIAEELKVKQEYVGVMLLRARQELRRALEQPGAMAAGGTK